MNDHDLMTAAARRLADPAPQQPPPDAPCEACGGEGGSWYWDQWRVCPVCHGTGKAVAP